MKFTVTMKDPDAAHDSIREAVSMSRPDGLSDDEWGAVSEVRHEEMREFVKKWLQYDEYAYIEFDTEAGTAVLLRADRLAAL